MHVSKLNQQPSWFTTHVRQSSIWDTDPNVEQEHQPSLGIQEGFNHLLPLECFVLNSGLISSNAVDGNSFLTLGDEFGRDRVVWQEYANNSRPDNCHSSSDPEEVPPLVTTGNKSDSPPNWAGEADRQASIHQTGADGLLSVYMLATDS